MNAFKYNNHKKALREEEMTFLKGMPDLFTLHGSV